MAVRITYFVHGTTPDNERGIASGQTNTPLSDRGLRESRELKNIVRGVNFDAVYASDLLRAQQTAEIAFGDRYDIIFDKRLREIDDGDFTLQPVADHAAEEETYIEKPMPHGESYRDVEKRVADFLADLKEKWSGRRIVIVAHRFPQLSLEVLLNGKTWQEALANDWRKTKAWRPGWDYLLS